MSLKAKSYIALVIAAAIGTMLVAAIADPRWPEFGRFVQCFVLAVVASTFKIRTECGSG
jgi:membrane protein YdbS with pleckstrin-like domain